MFPEITSSRLALFISSLPPIIRAQWRREVGRLIRAGVTPEAARALAAERFGFNPGRPGWATR